MMENPITCGNCGTENPPGQDFCVDCEQPLSGSADTTVKETEARQRGASVIGGGDEVAGDQVGAGGLGTPRAIGLDVNPTDPRDR